MNEYSKIAGLLGLPSMFSSCINGELLSPLSGFMAPANWYGFPPALIPIWSEGSRPTYLGYWKHWFVEREPSFFKMYVASKRMTVEIARTPEQFFCGCIMSAIVAEDGLTDSIRQFAHRVGVDNINELDAVSLQTGDDPQGYTQLRQFSDLVPLESVRNSDVYLGGFPVPLFEKRNVWWERVCSFEVSEDVLKVWPSMIEIPPWLVPDNSKYDLFKYYVAEGRYDRAWLTLNSSGWTIGDAHNAIRALCRITEERVFHQIANAWIAVADDEEGGY